METKVFETTNTKLIYKYYDHSRCPNPEKEIERIKVIKYLNSRYKIDLGEIFLHGYVKNYNTDDPVLYSRILKKDIPNDDTRRNVIEYLKASIKRIFMND